MEDAVTDYNLLPFENVFTTTLGLFKYLGYASVQFVSVLQKALISTSKLCRVVSVGLAENPSTPTSVNMSVTRVLSQEPSNGPAQAALASEIGERLSPMNIHSAETEFASVTNLTASVEGVLLC